MKTNNSLITIDGPAYVGKSTIAQELAKLFDCIYVNTGHFYRAVSKLSIDKKRSKKTPAMRGFYHQVILL